MKFQLLVSTLLGVPSLWAQVPDPDSPRTVVLDEIVVSPGKTEERRSETPFMVELLKSKEVELLAPETAADMLQNSGVVFVQKSQMGGGSPVLRGLEANRVLIVVDGVRMNNAIYRGGHLQDVITIDPSMLDHTEIIFGPSSVVYGSDALGGVMHFYTRRPKFSSDSTLLQSRGAIGFTSANTAYLGHFDLSVGLKKVALLTSITVNIFDDLRAGSVLDPAYDSLFLRTFMVRQTSTGADTVVATADPFLQSPTAYNQYDFLQKIALRQSDRIKHVVNIQVSNSSHIPRYDRLTELSGGQPRFAEWHYGPQTRMLGSITSEVTSSGKVFNKASIVLAAQGVIQGRVSRPFNNPNRVSQLEAVRVYSVNSDFMKLIGQRHDIRYGLDVQHNLVHSEAHSEDMTIPLVTDAPTRYPPGGSTMTLLGAYLGHRFRATEQVILSEGIRFSMTSLRAEFGDTTFFSFPFSEITQKHSAVTGNIGLVLKPWKTWRVAVNGSSGFRSPNVDDLAKVFDSSPGFLIVPNPGLKPEMAYNAELSLEKTWLGIVRTTATAWITRLRNAMVVSDFTYNGQDSVMYLGVYSQVQAMQNAATARIAGITTAFAADFNEHFAFVSTLTFTHGRYLEADTDTLVPMDHIPPTFGRTALMFSSKRFRAECYAMYNGWKRLADYSASGEDNLQYATPYGMPPWWTLNVKVASDLSRNFVLQAGVENIFDIHYRTFASGISAPGRSINLTVRAKV